MIRSKSALRALSVLGLLTLGLPQGALGGEPSSLGGNVLQVSMAFLTNLAIHETGHFVMAEMAGAHDNSLDFFSKKEGNFFLGLSTVGDIEERSRFTYIMGGEIATGLSFEVMLRNYRVYPTTYRRALLFFNGTEFLWYSIYAFYLAPFQDQRQDPIAISQETGLSREAVVAIAATQAALNLYRIYSGQDRIIPYFVFDEQAVSFLVGVRY